MTARKRSTKRGSPKGSSMNDKSKSAKVVVRQPKTSAKKSAVQSSIVPENVVTVLGTLQKLSARPIRSAKSVNEVSFGRIFADGVYNAE